MHLSDHREVLTCGTSKTIAVVVGEAITLSLCGLSGVCFVWSKVFNAYCWEKAVGRLHMPYQSPKPYPLLPRRSTVSLSFPPNLGVSDEIQKHCWNPRKRGRVLASVMVEGLAQRELQHRDDYGDSISVQNAVNNKFKTTATARLYSKELVLNCISMGHVLYKMSAGTSRTVRTWLNIVKIRANQFILVYCLRHDFVRSPGLETFLRRCYT